MIDRVRLVTVCVSDGDRAIEFYTEKLGFHVRVDHPFGEGMRWIEVEPEGADTAVVLAPPGQHGERKMGGDTGIIFATLDIDKTYEELSKNGVQFAGEVDRPHHGPATVDFADEDGNSFRLIERSR